jgi:hypothetical protein
MVKVKKVLEVIRESGMTGLVRRAVACAYRRGIRPFLPSLGPVHYGGIPVAYDWKWGDRWMPQSWRPAFVQDIPDYESALVTGLKDNVRQGDTVVVIGGGVGVTATVAAMQVGPGGLVHCFEGSSEGVEKVNCTALLNGVAERVRVRHAVVGRSILVYGTEPADALVDPRELPGCDVLELDCEGAEVDVLRAMEIQPRVVLVETHGYLGAPTVLVASLLQERGYLIGWQGMAEPRLHSHCESRDIQVLVGFLNGALCQDEC